MPELTCPLMGCPWTYNSEFKDESSSIEMVRLHVSIDHSNQAAPQSSQSKTPKINRPTVDVGIDQEQWNLFKVRWQQFFSATDIKPENAPLQLFMCASEALSDLLLRSDTGIADHSVDEVLSAMESFAVIRVSKGVQRAELMKLKQGSEEVVRTFAARVKSKAQTCGFVTEGKCSCPCKKTVTVDYTQEVIKDVILAGISDGDIQTSVLETEGIEEKPVNDIIALIERKERARKAYKAAKVSAVSEFKRQSSRKNHVIPREDPKPPKRSNKISCPKCKHLFSEFNGRNTVPFKICFDCYKKSKQPKPSNSSVSANGSDKAEVLAQSSAVLGYSAVCIGANWRGHPTVTLKIRSVDRDAFATIEMITDTGAQKNLMSLDYFRRFGLGMGVSELQDVPVRLSAANKSGIDVIGGFNAQFQGESPSGEIVCCTDMVYVSPSVSGFYLSNDTMIDLGIIEKDFPVVGRYASGTRPASRAQEHSINQVSLIRAINNGCIDEEATESCSCPQRSAVPPIPKELPFDPVPANNEKMKEWLLDRYASSTFNTCPHRPLQQMAGPPVEIHIDPSATPKAFHKPTPIPLHWQQKVKEDLQRDVSLGILERVPYGVPVTWCHRMVVTRKHDGTPRRTVDLSPLNRFCKRETFSSESPFHLARRIPQNTWKTVTDAWNGYHSVPLRKSDRNLTTFITPFGLFRYTRTPQGFLSSGDSYNRRFDAILSDFRDKERCVDDTVHYDVDLKSHWWRTIEFLSLVGTSGVVLNPDKFQFAQKSVNFAGFKVSSSNIEPLAKYTDAIRTFPIPKNLTDVRSWFGLVNQVSNYAQLRDLMAPFRPLLSSKTKFFWNEELDSSFSHSKQAIVDLIQKGVRIFDHKKQTCLRTDWSKKGLGYFLLQKHCSCSEIMPNCCPNGWEVTLAGSRFLSGNEEGYAAIDGEALAIAWSLEQTRYFTMGCQDLLVVTDHKPLVGIFNDSTLDEAPSTRLFRIKRRTLPWRFTLKYLSSKTNLAADATSRHPTNHSEVSYFTENFSLQDVAEELLMCGINREMASVTSISWANIADETAKDQALSELIEAIKEGFQGSYKSCNEYLRYKNALYVQDGAVMFDDRVVVPQSLRRRVLDSLHAAHQGVSTMLTRAHAIVFWPGMSDDISKIRSQCNACNRNAPSQPPMPIKPVNIPLTPFEQVFADFFHFSGHSYLVIGDRLSGWSEVFATPSGTTDAGARGLIKCLRQMFVTFGVPTQVSSDGGPEFSAELTKEFMSTWDVDHRISSAYNAVSNGRAEVAVKSTKRLLMSNVGPTGSLNNDNFVRAMLAKHNTPDPDCKLSPSQILFGHPLRDTLSFSNQLKKFSYSKMSQRWKEAWRLKEDALRTRYVRNSEDGRDRRSLPPLKKGDRCFVQNQHGNHPKRWHLSGEVMDILPYDKYLVKVDGSRRCTHRNRRFLKRFQPISTSIPTDVPIYGKHDRNLPDTEVIQHNPDTDNGSQTDDKDTSGHEDPGVVVGDDRVTMSPPASSSSKPRTPLMLRRLRNHNEDGVKQKMANPLGRRTRERR